MPHLVLDVLCIELARRKRIRVADSGVRGFFGKFSHEWLSAFVEYPVLERAAHPEMVECRRARGWKTNTSGRRSAPGWQRVATAGSSEPPIRPGRSFTRSIKPLAGDRGLMAMGIRIRCVSKLLVLPYFENELVREPQFDALRWGMMCGTKHAKGPRLHRLRPNARTGDADLVVSVHFYFCFPVL